MFNSMWLISDLVSCRPVTISYGSVGLPVHPASQFC